MENATKALLIAGGVLIALLILSIGIYLYTQFSNQSKEYSEIISSVEIQKFNSKFEAYVGRTNITAQEIVTVVSLSKENGGQLKVYLASGISPLSFTTPEEFIKNNQSESFSCEWSNVNPKYDDNTGRIQEIRFKKN